MWQNGAPAGSPKSIKIVAFLSLAVGQPLDPFAGLLAPLDGLGPSFLVISGSVFKHFRSPFHINEGACFNNPVSDTIKENVSF